MKKTPPHNDDKSSTEKAPATQVAGGDVSLQKSPIGGYGAKANYSPADLTQKEWDNSKLPWSGTAQGRLAIRTFSRGILGAAFFTAGGLLTRKWMHDESVRNMRYMPETEHYTGGKYDASLPFFKQDNPLKIIAKLIDTVVGKPIEATVHALTGNEELAKNSVRFRPTKFKDAMHNKYIQDMAAYEAAVVKGGLIGTTLPARPRYYRGRSLGNEVVNVTFDFFCASIGDALGRDIVAMVDPNVKKKWIKDGRVDVPEAVKGLTRTTWRYLSYNGGEDWAVAIPYVYFMKGQRAAISHFSPGFEYDFDCGLNGGSFKVDKHNNVTGNYNAEGMVDLQTRFTVYNMGTLAYREAYDYISRKIHGQPAVLYGSPDKDTSNQTLGEKAANLVKWLARSTVKAGIYMTPAVPFFWITRTPQTKYRGLFIHVNDQRQAMTLNYEHPIRRAQVKKWLEDKAAGKVDIGEKPHRKYEHIYANELPPPSYKNEKTGFDRDTDVYFSRFAPDPDGNWHKQFEWVGEEWYRGRKMNPLARPEPLKPYGQSHSVFDALTNFIGRANHKAVRVADPLVNGIGKKIRTSKGLDWMVRTPFSLRGEEDYTRFTHSFVNASVSYTPYMYMKAELANQWDDGKMDMSTERMIDGASGLNWGEFKAGARETWRSLLHKPLTDEKREKEAQRRIEIDTSPPAAVNYNDGHDAIKQQRAQSNWRERLVQGEKPEVGANSPKSHAEREEMREALKDLQPPTNSIN